MRMSVSLFHQPLGGTREGDFPISRLVSATMYHFHFSPFFFFFLPHSDVLILLGLSFSLLIYLLIDATCNIVKRDNNG